MSSASSNNKIAGRLSSVNGSAGSSQPVVGTRGPTDTRPIQERVVHIDNYQSGPASPGAASSREHAAWNATAFLAPPADDQPSAATAVDNPSPAMVDATGPSQHPGGDRLLLPLDMIVDLARRDLSDDEIFRTLLRR